MWLPVGLAALTIGYIGTALTGSIVFALLMVAGIFTTAGAAGDF